jgi:hypothetical protein
MASWCFPVVFCISTRCIATFCTADILFWLGHGSSQKDGIYLYEHSIDYGHFSLVISSKPICVSTLKCENIIWNDVYASSDDWCSLSCEHSCATTDRYQRQNVSYSVLTSYQHNDLGLQGQCYLDWEKVSIEFKHNDSSKGLLFQSCYA